jgi:signal transduction histidine kinase
MTQALGRPPGSPGKRSEPTSFTSIPVGAEAVGKLAVGVIRELGGPVQNIVDHAQFLKDSVREIGRLMAEDPSDPGAVPSRARQEQSGISDLLEEIPSAASALLREASRLQALVGAAKDLSFFIAQESVSVDPNRLVAGAVELVRGIYSSIAELEIHFAELGELVCSPGILYRALFAVLECATRKLEPPKAGEALGKVRIETTSEAAGVCIRISRTTAKPSQELFSTQILNTRETALIAIEQMLQEQGGSLSVSSELGKGAMFCIRLPTQPTASTTLPRAVPAP